MVPKVHGCLSSSKPKNFQDLVVCKEYFPACFISPIRLRLCLLYEIYPTYIISIKFAIQKWTFEENPSIFFKYPITWRLHLEWEQLQRHWCCSYSCKEEKIWPLQPQFLWLMLNGRGGSPLFHALLCFRRALWNALCIPSNIKSFE